MTDVVIGNDISVRNVFGRLPGLSIMATAVLATDCAVLGFCPPSCNFPRHVCRPHICAAVQWYGRQECIARLGV